jgi:DNA-binding NarL/FixJ family response regulator
LAIIDPSPAHVAGDVIRVAILDQHPAARAGLDAILRAHPGIEPVGAAADRRELWALLGAAEPNVVVIDDLRLCLAIRARSPEVRVVLYTDRELTVAAVFAGASAVVDKTASTAELISAVEGKESLPPVTPGMQRRAAARLEGPDRAVLAMRLAGTPDRDIAQIAGVSSAVLAARYTAILARLI